MVYRTEISGIPGLPFGPELVWTYASEAAALFGERASISLGIVGPDGPDQEPAREVVRKVGLEVHEHVTPDSVRPGDGPGFDPRVDGVRPVVRAS